MTHHGMFDQICDRLAALIASGRLPDKAGQQAEQLRKRLETPVRFALIGPSGPERAQIINGLLGREVVPLGPRRPSLELGFGETETTRAMLSDGRSVTLEDPDAATDPDALFLSLTRNAPLLRSTHLLDVATDGSPEEMRRALQWASRRTDVFLWCSSRFETAEQDVWRSVDERFMDHAFLVLWGADRAARSKILKRELAGEFLDMIAIDLQAPPSGSDPGLGRLSEGLRRHAELGRQADNDSALMFLRKFAPLEPPPAATARPEMPEAAKVPVAAAEVPATPSRPGIDASAQRALEAVCHKGATLIRDRARQLVAVIRTAGPDGAEQVAGHCRQTIENLTEILDSASGMPESDRAELTDMLMNAEELLILMEIEGEGHPDVDSACLLLQLRREFEARLAA